MAKRREHDGVAIVGMSCMFPGAPDVDTYWRNILGKVDAVTDPPAEAWDVETYYDPEFEDTDKTYVKRGGYLGALTSFDPLKYGIPPVSVGGEPDQWLALKLAYDALEDAGGADLPPEVRARTGIVLGKGTYLNGGNAIAVQRGLVVSQTLALLKQLRPDYTDAELGLLREEMKRSLPPVGPEKVSGLVPNIIVGRIANRLDLMGPSYTVDAACASSLVAIQLAMRDLLDGACDLALAGGAQVWMPVPTLNVFCQLGALSRTETIRPFDKDADGTLLGEGIGMVVLKRTADAVRDGDRIYAVVRGVGVSSDGRAVSVMAPRVEGEELALRNAYEEAGVSPRSIGLIEAHGTATAVGDVVEIQALTRVFGERDGELPRCALGTVKSMISHTIPASGVAGVIKLALSLYHRVLPPTLNVTEPNPKLELEKTPFYINTETRPWIHGGPEPRRAGINAFGFGGINAHAVLEELPPTLPLAHLPPWQTEAFVLQAESAAGLAQAAGELARRVGAELAGVELAELAYAVNCGSERMPNAVRLAVVASSHDDLQTKLLRAVEKLQAPECRRIKDISGIYFEAQPLGREGKVVFVFPGEGAQYPNMLADLCLHFPEVREAFDRVDGLYRDHPRGYVTSDWVYPRPAFSEDERRHAEERLMHMDVAVEAVITANLAIHGLLGRLGLRADACVGHSTGEYSAAAAAGALLIDTEDRFRAFGHAMHRCYSEAESRDDLPRAVLLTLAADRERVEALAREAGGELYVAMDNCPHQVVVVGGREAVDRARELAVRDGLIYGELPYDRAVHTPLFGDFAEDLREVFAEIGIGAPTSVVYSCTTAAPYPADADAVRELFVEHWTHPVEFRRTIENLYEDGARVFIEAGPRGNMTGFLDDILRGRPYAAVPADLPRRTGTTQLNHLVAMLSVHDVELDSSYLYEHRGVRRLAADAVPSDEAGRATAEVSLAMSWPMLRLDGGAVARINASVPARNGAAPPQPAPTPAAVDPQHSVVAARHASTNGAAPHVAAAPLPNGDAELELVMETHATTMDRFLTAHEEIMQAFLAESELDGEAAAPATAVLAPPQPGPLLGDVTSTPGEQLVGRRIVDPAVDVYLRDHALGRAISVADPSLSALMVMPLTMSLEILAEAAAALVPGLAVVGLRDVRAHRWLAWEDQPRALEVTARRLASEGGRERVHVSLVDHDLTGADANVTGTPAVEAVVLLAPAYPQAPPQRAVTIGAPRVSRWSDGGLYDDEMFHGPCWQGVRGIAQTGPRGTVAELEVLPFARLLRDAGEPRFALDPVVLDAAGQVIGFWTAEHLDRGRVVFPFALDALDVFGPQHPVGEALTCSAEIELVGDQLVRSDIEVVGQDGRPWMRLAGWQDKRFDVPPQFRSLARVTDRTPISEEWPEPAAELAPPGSFQCRRLTTELPDRGFWKRVWAHRVLSRAEREQFRALRLPEPRVLEWLGARTAAKEAVIALAAQYTGLDLLPADVEIRPDASGRPLVVCAMLADVGLAPVVSLSHSQGVAVALAGLGGRVGVDLERLRTERGDYAAVAFAPAERQLLEQLPPELGDEWQLRFWCAKEAVGKALGTGLTRGPQGLAVTTLDRATGRVTVELGDEMAADHPELATAPIVVQLLRQEDFVVATTLCEQEVSDDDAA